MYLISIVGYPNYFNIPLLGSAKSSDQIAEKCLNSRSATNSPTSLKHDRKRRRKLNEMGARSTKELLSLQHLFGTPHDRHT